MQTLPTHNFNSNNKSKLVNNSDKGRVQRYSEDSFTKNLIGKRIKLTLANGTFAEGVLKQVWMFDILLEVKFIQNITINGKTRSRDSVKPIIYLKQHIVSVEVL